MARAILIVAFAGIMLLYALAMVGCASPRVQVPITCEDTMDPWECYSDHAAEGN
jgi:hypothetical protein